MMGLFFTLIYLGGVYKSSDMGKGFWRCFLWPYWLGRRIAALTDEVPHG